MGLTTLAVAAVAGLASLTRDEVARAASFLVRLNLGLVATHMLDGFATLVTLCSDAAEALCSGAAFRGLTPGDYSEKHPVSEAFLGFADGWGFPAMKLLLVGGSSCSSTGPPSRTGRTRTSSAW